MRTINGNIALFIVLTAAGCAGVDPGQAPSGSTVTPGTGEPTKHLVDRMRALDHDLEPGAQGEAVRTVYDYLSRYGYFPNDKLQTRYPAWRPIVATPPAKPDVYDDQMAAGVREFQVRSGIASTGIVDGPTREKMGMARCGIPDGIPPMDPGDKFNFMGFWYNAGFTWENFYGAPNVPEGTVYLAAKEAMATWTASSNLSFQYEDGGEVDIEPGSTWDSDALAETNTFTHNITFNDSYSWSRHGEIAGTYDLTSVLLHEIGHALGLAHSSNPAVMKSGVPIDSPYFQENLTVDDKVAISQRYDPWAYMGGESARDIAAGASGYTWIITNTPHPQSPGNFRIKAWDGTSWVADAGNGGAVRIAQDTYGYPWVVCNDGEIYRRTGTSPTYGGWQWIPGGAVDIAIGGPNRSKEAVWIISNEPHPGNPGNFYVKKWNPSTQNWDRTSGAGIRIGAGNTGSPWVVTSQGDIYRICTAPSGQCTGTSDFTNAYWQWVGGKAVDVAVSPWVYGNGLDYAFVTGNDVDSNGDSSIWAWQQQPAGGGSPGAEEKNEWVGLPGRAKSISVQYEGLPWVVTNSGAIFTTLK